MLIKLTVMSILKHTHISNIILYTNVCVCVYVLSCQVVSDSLESHGLQPAKLLCPWGFPGKNTGVNSHFLLSGIFLTQSLNPCLLHLLHQQEDSLPLSHLVSLQIPIYPLSIFSNQQLDFPTRSNYLLSLSKGIYMHFESCCVPCVSGVL